LSTGASSVALSGDGKLVAASTNGAGGELPEPGEAWVWEVDSGKALRTFRAAAESQPGEFISIAEVALSANGKQLAAAIGSGSRGRPVGLLIGESSADVRLWNLETGKEEFTLRGHTRSIARIAFSPDGKQVATASADQTIRLWDCATGKDVRLIRTKLANIEALAFSPDGRQLAIGGKSDDGSGFAAIWRP
jgi:WD40 repeat protein